MNEKRRSRRWLVPVGALLLVGCKLDIEAKITGYKPGSTSIMIVHVKSKPGAYFTCSSSCFPCTSFTMPQSGVFDLEIDIQGEAPSKQVCLSGKAGLFKGELSLPIGGPGGLPPTMEVNDIGLASCSVKKCLGGITLLPVQSFDMSADPGVIVEVAGKRFTTDEHSYGSTPVDVKLSPAIKDLALSTLCAKAPTRLGATLVALTFPDGAKLSKELPITSAAAYRSVDTMLRAVDKGPVLFPWERGGTAPPKGRRAAMILRGSECTTSGPLSATLSEAAFIVRSTSQTRVGTCEYDTIATNTKTQQQQNRGKASGKLTFHDELATAYDRFSGKVVATRTFEAPKRCSEKMGATITDQDTYVAETAVAAWAGAL